MKTCIRCKRTKLDFGVITMFHTEFCGFYTVVYDICRTCANELKNEAVRNYVEKDE